VTDSYRPAIELQVCRLQLNVVVRDSEEHVAVAYRSGLICKDKIYKPGLTMIDGSTQFVACCLIGQIAVRICITEKTLHENSPMHGTHGSK
jgi:hypothetical protein